MVGKLENEAKGKELDGIQLLIEWMEQQGKKETSQELLQVSQYLVEMQTQLSIMTKELQEVKQQLTQFPQEKAIKETIQEVSNLQKTMGNLSEKISTGKEYWKNTVEQAITTIREKGKEELNQILQKGISKVKEVMLESREKLATTLAKYQKLAKKIDNIGEELKQVGTSIGNVGRLVVGKDAKEISKEKQGIGITRGMNQPIQKHIMSLQQKLERTDNILEKLDRISNDLGTGKEEKQEQRGVSMQEKLSQKKEIVEQKKSTKQMEKKKGKQQETCLS